jgi:SAM-dependent methyltransferase
MSQTSTDADRALKSRHRAMWALGDYPAVATEVIPSLGPVLVMAADVQEGDRVLDVASGSGNVAVPAARAGGEVVATDLTPELFDAGREYAARQGVEVEWREADAESLPFPDHTFDKVLSCVGVMFAPHHRAAAGELVRTVRPGGTIGLISWTPEGFIGQMFAIMKPYVPPPPAGAQPPPLWGREEHVRELLGDRVEVIRAERRMLPVERFDSGAEFRDFFKATYGPTIAAYRNIADEPDRVAALDRELADLGDSALESGGTMAWEYLLLTARKRV